MSPQLFPKLKSKLLKLSVLLYLAEKWYFFLITFIAPLFNAHWIRSSYVFTTAITLVNFKANDFISREVKIVWYFEAVIYEQKQWAMNAIYFICYKWNSIFNLFFLKSSTKG